MIGLRRARGFFSADLFGAPFFLAPLAFFFIVPSSGRQASVTAGISIASVSRVLLLLPTTTYRAPDFLAAADKLGIEVTVASERSSTMENFNPTGLLTLDFADREGSVRAATGFAARHPIDAVVGVDDDTTEVAAAISAALGLPHNPTEAVAATRNKARMRAVLAWAGVRSPRHWLFHASDSDSAAAVEVSYPCVLKPTFLSASRGVIRADDPEAFRLAWRRIAALLALPDVRAKGGEAADEILVEEFAGGDEVALEGLLTGGDLAVLALFDKPDPLEGPFFEETIYVTPSRKPPPLQDAITEATRSACRALGLVDGPIHAELRCGAAGISIIEVAARSIGGLCSRTLRFGAGISLEELILRHALRGESVAPEREAGAAGVLMIPIPRAGRLDAVRGLEAARAVSGIREITISAHVGQSLVPLPEGSRYLGFLFSRAATPEEAEAALRAAHARLTFVIEGA